MNTIRHSKTLLAIFALLLIFSACKSESPTAPPTGGGGNPPGGGGTTTPPTTVEVTLTTSSANPQVDTSVTITATVNQGGQPVPNGTAVEFSTSAGAFNGTSATSIIRTTTNGVATVTLSSSAAVTARVTAVVGSSSRTVDVAFQPRPVTPTPPNTAPTIVSVAPNTGRPAGGQTIRITGTNFRAPVRVFFDINNGQPVEGFVVAVTETTIDVVTPAFNVAAGAQVVTDIIVLTEAGTATERRVERDAAFTFSAEQLTPRVSTTTPNSGPVTGGTAVAIIGDGFQAPVQVLFGAAEARVINVTFNRIDVEAPAARDTSADGSGAVTGFVPITVRNIESGTSVSSVDAFRYVSAAQITTAGPTEGLFTGGTRIEINGIGFVAPVAVTVAGVAAQPISVSGTRITVITSGVAISSCADVVGPIIVTNAVNGDSATGPNFRYRVPRPAIISVSPEAQRGGTVSVTVANAIGTPRLRLGTNTLSITGSTQNTNGTTTFTATVPNTLVLQTQACEAVPGVSRQLPTAFDVTYTSVETTCTDTATNAATIAPPANTPAISVSPAAFTPFSARITPGTGTPPGPATVAPSQPQTLSVVNSGTGNLTISNVTQSGSCGNFAISFPSTPVTLQTCEPFTISAIYTGQTTTGTEQCSVTVITSAGNRTFTLTGTSQ